jgi:hypothetical protein
MGEVNAALENAMANPADIRKMGRNFLKIEISFAL